MLVCLFLVRKIPYVDLHPEYEGEPLLIEDHASPVGYKVPSVPDFEIDPSMAEIGNCCFPSNIELVLGLITAVGVGSFVIILAFTTWDDKVFGDLQGVVGSS